MTRRLLYVVIQHPVRAFVACVLLAAGFSGGTTAAVLWLIGDDD